jgi:DNA-binding MarR family transcriptional regulator
VTQIPEEKKRDIDRLASAIEVLYTESRRLTKALAAQYGLTGPQLTVVKVLESLGEVSLSELAERIHAQNSTVTGIIDRMQREGLVLRARSFRDRRVIQIKLTSKGRELARAVPLQPAETLRGALESLSPDESRVLLGILTKLADEVRSRAAASLTSASTSSGHREGN